MTELKFNLKKKEKTYLKTLFSTNILLSVQVESNAQGFNIINSMNSI